MINVEIEKNVFIRSVQLIRCSPRVIQMKILVRKVLYSLQEHGQVVQMKKWKGPDISKKGKYDKKKKRSGLSSLRQCRSKVHKQGID